MHTRQARRGNVEPSRLEHANASHTRDALDACTGAHTAATNTAVAKPQRPHHRGRGDATTLAGSFLPQNTPRSRLR